MIERPGKLRLNLGCGRDYRKGWVNIDISQDVEAELHMDLRVGRLPFNKDSAEEIYISGVLEQIGSNDQLIHVMNDAHRVLKPGGTMVVVVPNARYAIAHRDPMDVRKFTAETFSYFEKDKQEHRLYGSVYGFLPWSQIRIEENARHIFTATFTK